MEAVQEFRNKALTPNHPVTRGTAQNPDIYFQTREASNKFYNDIVGIVEKYMAQMSELTGRKYSLFDYYGATDARKHSNSYGFSYRSNRRNNRLRKC